MVHQVKDVRGEADATLAALKTILRRLETITDRRRTVIETVIGMASDLDCCEACGCLCLPDEHCLGCLAARTAAV